MCERIEEHTLQNSLRKTNNEQYSASNNIIIIIDDDMYTTDLCCVFFICFFRCYSKLLLAYNNLAFQTPTNSIKLQSRQR